MAQWAGEYIGEYAGYANRYLLHRMEPHKERVGRTKGEYAGYANRYLLHRIEPHKERVGRTKGRLSRLRRGPVAASRGCGRPAGAGPSDAVTWTVTSPAAARPMSAPV